jgi:branched-chain amino acid transport system ATP-binding protein
MVDGDVMLASRAMVTEGSARGGASPALFSCSDISLDLGGREILRGINLHVQPGEVLGIIGPNGAGKTSLFEVLSGRMQPKSGTVSFKGSNVTSLPLVNGARNLPTCGGPIFPTWAGMVISPRCDRGSRS